MTKSVIKEDLETIEANKVDKFIATRSRVSFLLGSRVQEIFERGTLKSDKTIVIGDVHLDYEYNKGAHRDYAENCRYVMRTIVNYVKDNKVTTVIFAGDFIGVKTGVGYIRNRDFLAEVMEFLLELSNLNCLPIVLRGNHDIYQPSDYAFLSQFGYFLDPSQFSETDITPDKTLRLTPSTGEETSDILFDVHFVPFGCEYEDLNLKQTDNISNVVIAHNNFYVRGKAEFYVTDNAIDVTSHMPFYNADIILTGDIHQPTSNMLEFNYGNGEEGIFLNLGCPTRPQRAPRYDVVWFYELNYTEEDGAIKPSVSNVAIPLQPYDEVFLPVMEELDDAYGETDFNASIEERKANLETVLQSIGTIQTGSQDYTKIVDSVAFVSDEVKELAKTYIQRAVTDY